MGKGLLSIKRAFDKLFVILSRARPHVCRKDMKICLMTMVLPFASLLLMFCCQKDGPEEPFELRWNI